jgi:hypothetical protein
VVALEKVGLVKADIALRVLRCLRRGGGLRVTVAASWIMAGASGAASCSVVVLVFFSVSMLLSSLLF